MAINAGNATSVVVFGVIGVSVGILVEFLFKYFKVPVPYIVLIFYIGVVAGAIITRNHISTGDFLELSAVSANLMIYVFLPVLLFSETMTINWHHLIQTFNQSVLLAGPGGVIVAVLIAVCAKYMLPFGWSWLYCFLFGSILCATDPVSVVALLKSTRASAKLTMAISGESLLNDGSAMILYFFFYNIINGETYTVVRFIEFCAEMLLLSPLTGFIIGGITAKIMRRIDSPTDSRMDIQVILSFACAFVSFAVAEAIFSVSGVLSCCTAGVTVSLFAPLHVLNDHKYHRIWSGAEWICNTLIFLIAGLIGAAENSSAITPVNFGFLVVFFFVLLITRGIMAFLLLPGLNYVGTPFTINETIFTTYAGLRGALGIALALSGANNAKNRGQSSLGNQLFFMVSGLASLTLLINGSTAGALLLRLKLVDDPNAPVSAQLNQVLTRIKLFMKVWLRKELAAMKQELGDYDENELLRLCALVNPQYGEIVKADERVLSEERELERQLSSRVSSANFLDKDLVTYTRTTFLSVVRARYQENVHNGLIGTSSSSAKLLLHSVDVALDDVDKRLMDWDVVVRFLKPNRILVFMARSIDRIFYCCNLYSGLVSRLDAYQERIALYVVTNFIDAHEYAQGRIHFFLGGTVMENGSNDIAEPEERVVLEESKSLVEQAKQLLKSIKAQALQMLYTHRAAKTIIHKQEEILNQIVKEGILSEQNAKHLFEHYELERDRIDIERAEQDKLMLKDNIRGKINDEREMRSSVSQKDSSSGVLNPMSISARSSFRLEHERLSEQSHGISSYHGSISIKRSDAIPSSLLALGNMSVSAQNSGVVARPSLTSEQSMNESDANSEDIEQERKSYEAP